MNSAFARFALIISCVANAAFAVYFISRPASSSARSAAASVNTSDSGPMSPAVAAPGGPSSTAVPGASPNLWRDLDTDDPHALVAHLRAAGFSPAAVRAVASAKIRQRYAARLDALKQQVDDTPYWMPSPIGPSRSAEYYEQRSQIYREQSQVMHDLVAVEDLGTSESVAAYDRRRFGNLPRAAMDAIGRLERDYADMNGEVRSGAHGIYLPEDRNILAVLEREKRQDLARILTPEQLADYDLRTSPLTSRLSHTLTLLDATEAEFQAIYEAYAPFKETLFPGIDGASYAYPSKADERQARLTITQALTAELGPARVMELQRASNNDFQLLASAAERGGLPLSVAREAYDLRTAVCAESARIGSDLSRSLEDRTAALRQLADNTQLRLVTLLGGQGENYARSADWLRTLRSGLTVGFDGVTTTRHLLPVAPAPKK